MKRQIVCHVELNAIVTFNIDAEGQLMADPSGEMSDGQASIEAIENFVSQSVDVFPFGERNPPVELRFVNVTITPEGEDDYECEYYEE